MTIATKYAKTQFEFEEYFSEGKIGLVNAVDKFEEKFIGLNSFASYACELIKTRIFNYAKHLPRSDVSLDEVLNETKSEFYEISNNSILNNRVFLFDEELFIHECFSKAEKFQILYEAIEKLTDRRKEVIKRLYGLSSFEDILSNGIINEDFGTHFTYRHLTDIAKEIGCTRSNIHQIYNGALKELKENIIEIINDRNNKEKTI